MFRFSEKSLERMEGIDHRLSEVMKKAIKISKVDFGVPPYGGLRTAEEQFVLFEEGKSTKDGYDRKSYHQTGKAVDVYAYVDGKASWEEEHLAMIAAAVLQAANILGYHVMWGGLWKNFVDMPHFQIEG